MLTTILLRVKKLLKPLLRYSEAAVYIDPYRVLPETVIQLVKCPLPSGLVRKPKIPHFRVCDTSKMGNVAQATTCLSRIGKKAEIFFLVSWSG